MVVYEMYDFAGRFGLHLASHCRNRTKTADWADVALVYRYLAWDLGGRGGR